MDKNPIVFDSKERIAFELMHHIHIATGGSKKPEATTKNYWINLYIECRNAVLKGRQLEQNQKSDEIDVRLPDMTPEDPEYY